MLDRTVAPPFAKEFSFPLPKPEIIPLATGNALIWVKDLQQQVVKIEVVMKAGKWYEPTIGLAHFTLSMLEKGAGKFSAEQIAEVLDLYGAQIELSAGSDFSSLSVYSLSNKLDKVLPMMIAMLSEPTFPEHELDLMKAIFIENLKVNLEKNSYLASKQFKKNVFGAHHPYGSTLDIEEVETTITTQGLNQFFNDRCQPFEVYVTGSLTDWQIGEVVKALSQFAPSKPNALQPVRMESQNKIAQIEKASSLQSSLRIGNQTIGRHHPDYFQLLLVNHLLGGYFGSRLMKNIREEKGLTYGIHSSVSAHKNASVFSIGTDVNVDKRELTMDEIQKEIVRLQQEPISNHELEVGRNHFLGSLQLELSNPFSVTEKIKNIRLNELPSDYYTRLSQSVASASPDTLQSVANSLMTWGLFHQISVG